MTISGAAQPAAFVKAGDVIKLIYTVTNTGNSDIWVLTVKDSTSATAATCVDTILNVGATTTCQHSYAITAADVAAGQPLSIQATADGIKGGTTVPQAKTTTTVAFTPQPALTASGTATPATFGQIPAKS